MMEKLIKAVVEYYDRDLTKASVVSSFVDDKYYVSIVRYNGSYARDKVVICSVTEHDLSEAYTQLSYAWLKAIGQGPEVNKLKELVYGRQPTLIERILG